MKLIHCGDIHLDSQLTTKLRKEKAQERNRELWMTFEELVAFAVQEQVQVILICGDLFDTDCPANYLVQEFFELVEEHSQISFFYVRGNHDRKKFWKSEGALQDNFYVFKTPFQQYKYGKVTITGAQCEGESLEEDLQYLQLDENQYNIVMLHGMAVNTLQQDSTEDQIPLLKLQNQGIDYLALGHIHTYEKYVLDQRGCYCYCGCLEGRGFDECGEKGFVYMELWEDDFSLRTQFVPFGKRRVYVIDVDVEQCVSSMQMVRRIEETMENSMVREKDYVRVRIVGDLPAEVEKNLSYIESAFLDSYYYFEIEDKTQYAIPYDAYQNQKTLRGEFVRLVEELEIAEEEKNQILRFGMLALSGEELPECN